MVVNGDTVAVRGRFTERWSWRGWRAPTHPTRSHGAAI